MYRFIYDCLISLINHKMKDNSNPRENLDLEESIEKQAKEILEKANTSFMISLALQFTKQEQGYLAPARVYVPKNRDSRLYP